jgi:hypothetical protein
MVVVEIIEISVIMVVLMEIIRQIRIDDHVDGHDGDNSHHDGCSGGQR